MQLHFNYQRTLQAVAELLRLHAVPRMNYMRLLKLLYIADREMLATHAFPITGDAIVAMERGPVLNRTYDLIRANEGDWAKFIHKEHYDVVLANDPGKGQLSKAILAKLREVTERYQDMDEWDMVEETHKLEEWRKHFPPGSKSSQFVPWEDVLIAQGKESLIPEVESDERSSALFDEVFKG
jgi:uncharacterized phage-associated protein